jgi:ParB family chromosome partitioning protein
MNIRQIPLDQIIILRNRRAARNLEELKASILEIGLLNPITITEDFTLIAGLNRYTACRELGWQTAPCSIMEADQMTAELAMIDENLVRNELTTLERSEQLKRRKELYEAMHPETKHVTERGGPGRGHKTTAEYTAVSFVEDTAKKIGQSPRTVRQEVQIASNIIPEVKEALADTPIANRKTDLIEIARMEPEKQKETAKKIKATKAKTVRTVIDDTRKLERRQPVTEIKDSDALWNLKRWWKRATKKDRKLFLSWIKEEKEDAR